APQPEPVPELRHEVLRALAGLDDGCPKWGATGGRRAERRRDRPGHQGDSDHRQDDCRDHPSTVATPSSIARVPRARSRRAASAALLVGGVFLLLVQLVPGASKRLSQESPGWIVVAAGFELCCLAGYSALFHAVFARRPHRLRRAFSAQVGVGELGGFAIVPT